jgi:hypothetical protein
MHVHAGQLLEIRPDTMGHDVQLVSAPREMSREGEIRDVHPPEGGEVAGDEKPGCHLRSR